MGGEGGGGVIQCRETDGRCLYSVNGGLFLASASVTRAWRSRETFEILEDTRVDRGTTATLIW